MSKTVMVPLKDLFEQAMRGNRGRKISKRIAKGTRVSKNSGETGFRNTYKVNCPSCRQNFMYQYVTYLENGKRKTFNSVNLLALRDKVVEAGHIWAVEDRYYALKTAKEVGLPLKDLM